MTGVHPTADVQTSKIGTNTFVWQYTIVLTEATIGNNCNINCHCFIENDVVVGNNVTIKAGVYLWDGIEIEDDVFVGPNVTFTNDKYPRSKQYPSTFDKTIIRQGASIGAASVIVGAVEIGAHALVGAGSVVTRSVPANALVRGNPAKQVGWVDNKGQKLVFENGKWTSPDGEVFPFAEIFS